MSNNRKHTIRGFIPHHYILIYTKNKTMRGENDILGGIA